MAAPWEKYTQAPIQAQPQAKPWEKYGASPITEVAPPVVAPPEEILDEYDLGAFSAQPIPGEKGLVKSAQAVGGVLGLEKATDPFARMLARATVPGELKEAIPKPTAGELVGGGLQVGAIFIPYGKLAGAVQKGIGGLTGKAVSSAWGNAVAGATGGYAVEAGEKIQRGEAPTPGLTTAIGAVAPIAIPAVARKLLPKPVDQALKRNIKEGISKGIRPSVPTVGKTAAQREAYYNKAQDAVESIVGNKANLQFTDEFGTVVKGKLPENLNQFSDAIAQTKKGIFTQYDDLAQRAGKKGAAVELSGVAKELDAITKSKVLKTMQPEVIDYATKRAAALNQRGRFTTAEAQDAITALNSSLESFYKNPSYDTASKAHIDALIANNLRKTLDDVIEKTTEKGYQALKSQYGALKSIEKDTTRRAIVDARKNIKGLVDFSDILSGAGAVHGLIGLNPATLASAATAKGLAAWTKRINDPNRIIGNMFKKSERLLSEPIVQRKGFKTPRFPGDVIAEDLGPVARRKLREQRGSMSLKKKVISDVIVKTKKGFDLKGQSKVSTERVFDNKISRPPREARQIADDLIEKGQFEALDEISVPINNLVPTQKFLSGKNLDKVIDTTQDTGADLLKIGGKVYILDGHHRIAKNIIEGKRIISGHLLDLDKP